MRGGEGREGGRVKADSGREKGDSEGRREGGRDRGSKGGREEVRR